MMLALDTTNLCWNPHPTPPAVAQQGTSPDKPGASVPDNGGGPRWNHLPNGGHLEIRRPVISYSPTLRRGQAPQRACVVQSHQGPGRRNPSSRGPILAGAEISLQPKPAVGSQYPQASALSGVHLPPRYTGDVPQADSIVPPIREPPAAPRIAGTAGIGDSFRYLPRRQLQPPETCRSGLHAMHREELLIRPPGRRTASQAAKSQRLERPCPSPEKGGSNALRVG